MDLNDYRAQMDAIDRALTAQFVRRMDCAAQIARWKQARGRAVEDPDREREKLEETLSQVPEELRDDTASLYGLLFALSRCRQSRLMEQDPSGLRRQISQAVAQTPQRFPPEAAVACQGTAGGYAQTACGKLFRRPDILYVSGFQAVFSALESGRCRYGVLPLENSAGSVNAVYDRMLRHAFYIVRSVHLKVGRHLPAAPGADRIPCENTAAAAAGGGSARSCTKRCGPGRPDACVRDAPNDFIRFICISKDLEIYPGADRTSLTAVLPHRPGSLCRLLTRPYALGLDLRKLESRPLPGREDAYLFYLDLESPVCTPAFWQLMAELPALCQRFSYLGSYSEVV